MVGSNPARRLNPSPTRALTSMAVPLLLLLMPWDTRTGWAAATAGNTDAPDHMWMGEWGLLAQAEDRFLAGRGLRALTGISHRSFTVPQAIENRAYNPSLALLPATVREQLNCTECVFLASVRHLPPAAPPSSPSL